MKIFACNFYPNWQQKIVCSKNGNNLLKRIEIIDLNTMQRYKEKSIQHVALKAFLIFLFNPLLIFLKIVINVFQIAFDFAAVSVSSSVDMAIAFKEMDLFKIFKIYLISKIDLIKYIAEDIINIVKAPIFGFGMQLAAFFTIFFPDVGRKFIGVIERKWNHNKELQFDIIKNHHGQKYLLKFFWDTLINRDKNVVFYLAPCFQSIGSLKDKNIVSYSDI
jgi:hypothetical protein